MVGGAGRKIDSPATSSWTSLPGNSHQLCLGSREWMTGKEGERAEGFWSSPTSAPPQQPVPGLRHWGTMRPRWAVSLVLLYPPLGGAPPLSGPHRSSSRAGVKSQGVNRGKALVSSTVLGKRARFWLLPP